MAKSLKESHDLASEVIIRSMTAAGYVSPRWVVGFYPVYHQSQATDLIVSQTSRAQMEVLERALMRMGFTLAQPGVNTPEDTIRLKPILASRAKTGHIARIHPVARLAGMVEFDAAGEPDFRRSHDVQRFEQIMREEAGLVSYQKPPTPDRVQHAGRENDACSMLEQLMGLPSPTVMLEHADPRIADETVLFIPGIQHAQRYALCSALHALGFDIVPDPPKTTVIAPGDAKTYNQMQAIGLHPPATDPERIVLRGNAEGPLAELAKGAHSNHPATPYRRLQRAYTRHLDQWPPRVRPSWQEWTETRGDYGVRPSRGT